MFLSGFEPLAFRLGGGRSILLSYRNINFINDIPANLFIITDLTKVSQDLSCNFCELIFMSDFMRIVTASAMRRFGKEMYG